MRILTLFLLLVTLIAVSLHAQTDGGLYVPPVVSARGVMQNGFSFQGSIGGDDMKLLMPEYGEVRSIPLPRVLRHGNTLPLLPMIFFDGAGSATIPERYARFTAPHFANDYADSLFVPGSSEGATETGKMLKYHQLLNILGYRLRRYPDATISLEGGYADEAGETERVANNRAEVVREYLTAIWRIAPERVTVLPARLLADSAAPLHRRQEARRVSVVSNDWRIVGPLRYSISLNVPTTLVLGVLIDPKVDRENVREVELSIALGDAVIYRSVIPGSRDSARYSFVGSAEIPQAEDTVPPPIAIQVVVTTNTGKQFASNAVTLPFEEQRKNEPARGDDSLGWRQIPFFEWRSMYPGPLQQMYVDSIAADLSRTIPPIPTLYADASREASEAFTGEVPGVMETEGYTMGKMRFTGREPKREPRKQEEVAMRSMEEIERVARKMFSTVSGGSEMSTPPTNDTVRVSAYGFIGDSVLIPRLAMVDTLLASRISSSIAGMMPTQIKMVDGVSGPTEEEKVNQPWIYSLLAYEPLPEDRYYKRSVTFEPHSRSRTGGKIRITIDDGE